MRTLVKNICIVVGSILVVSCTDVINVEVPVAPPRLVIEASLDWEKGTDGKEQAIKLSMSNPYFDTSENNKVVGASVKIINNENQSETLFVDQNNGFYTTAEFNPVLNQSYTLTIINKGETYTAIETFSSVPDIEEVYQTTEKGVDKDALEVNIVFKDPLPQVNFYLLKVKEQADLLPQLFYGSDDFTDGNLSTIIYERLEDEDNNQKEFKSEDVLDIKLHSVSERYYNYMRLLIDQYDNVGNPFSATPVPLKGNCINQENPENYAFGYFRLTQVVKSNFTFE